MQFRLDFSENIDVTNVGLNSVDDTNLTFSIDTNDDGVVDADEVRNATINATAALTDTDRLLFTHRVDTGDVGDISGPVILTLPDGVRIADQSDNAFVNPDNIPLAAAGESASSGIAGPPNLARLRTRADQYVNVGDTLNFYVEFNKLPPGNNDIFLPAPTEINFTIDDDDPATVNPTRTTGAGSFDATQGDLVFTYTVQPGDVGVVNRDSIRFNETLSINDSGVTTGPHSAGNLLEPIIIAPAIDSIAPTIVGITTAGDVAETEDLTFYVDFSEDVDLNTLVLLEPAIFTFNIDTNSNGVVDTGEERTATGQTTFTDRNRWTFTYPTVVGDEGTINQAVNLTLRTARVTDTAANPIVDSVFVGRTLLETASVFSASTLTSSLEILRVRADEYVTAGESLTFDVDFNEDIVRIAGTPTLNFTVNGIEKTANFNATRAQDNVLSFDYTVVEADVGNIDRSSIKLDFRGTTYDHDADLGTVAVAFTPTLESSYTLVNPVHIMSNRPALFEITPEGTEEIVPRGGLLGESAIPDNGLNFNQIVLSNNNPSVAYVNGDANIATGTISGTTYDVIFRGSEDNILYALGNNTSGQSTFYTIDLNGNNPITEADLRANGPFKDAIATGNGKIYALAGTTSSTLLEFEVNSDGTVPLPGNSGSPVGIKSFSTSPVPDRLDYYDGKLYVIAQGAGTTPGIVEIRYLEEGIESNLEIEGVAGLTTPGITNITLQGIQGGNLYFTGLIAQGTADETTKIIITPLSDYVEGYQVQERVANYASGSGTNKLNFRYIVDDADEAENGINVSTDTLQGVTDVAAGNQANLYNYSVTEDTPFEYAFGNAFVNRRPQVNLTTEPSQISRTSSTLGEDIDVLVNVEDRHDIADWNLTIDFTDGFGDVRTNPANSAADGYSGTTYTLDSDNVSGVDATFNNIIYYDELEVLTPQTPLNQTLVNGKFVVNVDDPGQIPGYNNYAALLAAAGANDNLSSEVGVVGGTAHGVSFYNVLAATDNNAETLATSSLVPTTLTTLTGEISIPAEQQFNFSAIGERTFISPAYHETLDDGDAIAKLSVPASFGVIEGSPTPPTTAAITSSESLPIRIDNASVQDILVGVVVTSESASADDYELSVAGGQLTSTISTATDHIVIPAGETYVEIPFDITGDVDGERDETFKVVLSVIDGPGEFTQDETTIVIIDDDFENLITAGISTTTSTILTATATTTSATSTIVEEGENAEIVVSLPAGITLDEPLRFTYNVDTTPSATEYIASETDYEFISNVGVIEAGQTSTTISIPIIDDAIVEADGIIDAASSITGTISVGTDTIGNFQYEQLQINFTANPNSITFSNSIASPDSVTIDIDDNDRAEIRFYGSSRLDHLEPHDPPTIENDVLYIDINEGAQKIGPIVEVVSGPAEVPLVFDLEIATRQTLNEPRLDNLDRIVYNKRSRISSNGITPAETNSDRGAIDDNWLLIDGAGIEYAENNDFSPTLNDTNRKQTFTIPTGETIYRTIFTTVNVSAGHDGDGDSKEIAAVYFNDESSPDNVYVSKEDPERVLLVIDDNNANNRVNHVWIFRNNTSVDTVERREDADVRVILSEVFDDTDDAQVEIEELPIGSTPFTANIQVDGNEVEGVLDVPTSDFSDVIDGLMTFNLTGAAGQDMIGYEEVSTPGRLVKNDVTYRVVESNERIRATISSDDDVFGENITLLKNGSIGTNCSSTDATGCLSNYVISATFEETRIPVYNKHLDISSSNFTANTNSLNVEEQETASTEEITFALELVRNANSVNKTETIGYRTIDGTATALEDYTPLEGTVTFTETEAVKTFTYPLNQIYEDNEVEGDETFSIEFSLNSGNQYEIDGFEVQRIEFTILGSSVTTGTLATTGSISQLTPPTSSVTATISPGTAVIEEIVAYETFIDDIELESADYDGRLEGFRFVDSGNQNEYLLSGTADEPFRLETSPESPAFLVNNNVNDNFLLNTNYAGLAIINTPIDITGISVVDAVILEEERRGTPAEDVVLVATPGNNNLLIIEDATITNVEGTLDDSTLILEDVTLGGGVLGTYEGTNSNFVELLGAILNNENSLQVNDYITLQLDTEGNSIKAIREIPIDPQTPASVTDDLDLSIETNNFWGTIIAEDYNGTAQPLANLSIVGFVGGEATDRSGIVDGINLVSGDTGPTKVDFTHTLRNHLYGLDALDTGTYNLTFSARDVHGVNSIAAQQGNSAFAQIDIGEIIRQITRPSTGSGGGSGTGSATRTGTGGSVVIIEFGPLSSTDQQTIRRMLNVTASEIDDITLVRQFITPEEQRIITTSIEEVEEQARASDLSEAELDAFVNALNELRAEAVEEITVEQRTRVALYRVEGCDTCEVDTLTFVERHFYIDELFENGYDDDTRLRFVEIIPKHIAESADDVGSLAQVFFDDPIIYHDRSLGELRGLPFFDSSYVLSGDKVSDVRTDAEAVVLVLPEEAEPEEVPPEPESDGMTDMQTNIMAVTIAILIAVIVLLGAIIIMKRKKLKQ